MRNVIAAIAALLIALAGGSGLKNDSSQPDHLTALDHYRTRVVRVADIDCENDTVYAMDGSGHVWGFYGVDDWVVGDWASLILYDNNTPIIYDDVIVRVTYGGIFE